MCDQCKELQARIRFLEELLDQYSISEEDYISPQYGQ